MSPSAPIPTMRRAAVALLLLPGALSAQLGVGEPLPGDTVRLLGGVTVDVARPTLTTGGASVITVDVDSLGHLPVASLEDVMRAMPFVQVRSNSRGEAQPALRGGEDRQITILMDGAPLTLGWDHRADLSVVPVAAARTLTLARGLSSVLYGPNTLGGVLDIDVAGGAGRDPSAAPVTVGLGVDHTGATQVSALTRRVVDRSGGQWALGLGGGARRRDGVPLPGAIEADATLRDHFLSDGGLRLNSDERRVDGFLTARYRANSGPWAALSVSGIDSERGVPPEAHLDDPRLWRYPEQRRSVVALSGGTGRTGTGDEPAELRVSASLQSGATSIERYATEAYRTVVETEDADDRVVTLRLLGDRTVAGRIALAVAGTWTDVAHEERLFPGETSRYRQRLWSIGGEAGMRLGGSGATRVTLGAAWDGADTPESGDKPLLGRMGAWGGRLGVTSIVESGVLVHAGLSRRARFPSLRELYSGALGRFEPNPDLRAETLLGSEVGFTVRRGTRELQLVGFHHRYDDGIVRSSVRGADGVARFRRVNQAELRGSGVELLAVASAGPVTVTGDLTVQRVRGRDGAGVAVPVEYEPSSYGRAGVQLPLPARGRGSVSVRYLGAQWCANPEIGDAQRLRPSASVDLGAERTVTLGSRRGALTRLQASVSVLNATDGAIFDQCGLPRPGRSLHVQLRLW